MATQIRAIETVYDGYRFRSRLEARWAVFFNALGIPYEYEKEGYDLSGYRITEGWADGELPPQLGWYLPDFWLPTQKCWVEIKGMCPATKERASSFCLGLMTGHPVFTQFGPMPFPHPGAVNSDAALMQAGWRHWWCECPVCGLFGMAAEGRPQGLACNCVSDDPRHYGAHRPTYDASRILAAYAAGRHARFEHGESPGRRG